MNKKTVATALFIFLLASCSHNENSHSNHNMTTNNGQHSQHNETKTTARQTGNEFTIVAKEATHQLNRNVTLPVYTYNGSVPGTEIRVKQGEHVKIHLKNELKEPVTIHWHGYPVPNNMDGIPGVTMNAVQPGKTFTYEFDATVPGTYWYHSHQNSVNQVDKGLYGALIVEPKEKEDIDRDYTLIIDEWMSHPMTETTGGHSGHEMAYSTSNMNGHDMSMYDIFTINGKSGDLVEPLKVKQGERVKLRLINAGYMTHKLHLHGHQFQVTAIDGQPIKDPKLIKDELLAIAPGERYDIEFTANHPGTWYLECHGTTAGTDGMKVRIEYEGKATQNDHPNSDKPLPIFDVTAYGKHETGPFTLKQHYDLEYTMKLGTATAGNNTVFTINGKTFPNTEPIQVKKGDLVKVKLINTSKTDDHPMHLHGHFFQVLSKNGTPLTGYPVIKDTLNIKPGEEYVVAFQADNPGNWMFHCHDLHHAASGMVTEVHYQGYRSSFQPDPSAGNVPE
ncbi:multicopper oxidase family protein [Thermaerobacillus caldiproteolyticus]|uniref:FtsP/CotA-like multicopper oxidase with cupredoxin domain n=1 Tax=Thermaerobacillus caldiproteolyticus TaxID=247480 RepID=A0A7V9Z777_9BACL|nr:multicopper oxidase family protein [Anoxybacillus caldiproteolyticus]MBA2875203.1 FtsP/CotA-like multicopper oxidase with cupredoxin domain [Anoxybacillus caldiproteolyticus]